MDGPWGSGAGLASTCSMDRECNDRLLKAYLECISNAQCKMDVETIRWMEEGVLSICFEGSCICNPTFWKGGSTCTEPTSEMIGSVLVHIFSLVLALFCLGYGLYPLVFLRLRNALPIRASEVACISAASALVAIVAFDIQVILAHFSRSHRFLTVGSSASVAIAGACTIFSLLRLGLTWVDLASRVESLACYSSRLNRWKIAMVFTSLLWLFLGIASLSFGDVRIIAAGTIFCACFLAATLLFGSSLMFFVFQPDKPQTFRNWAKFFKTVFFASHKISQAPEFLQGTSTVEGNAGEGKSAGTGLNSSLEVDHLNERQSYRKFSRRILQAAFRINTFIVAFTLGVVLFLLLGHSPGKPRRPLYALYIISALLMHTAIIGAMGVLFWFFRKSYRVRMKIAVTVTTDNRASSSVVSSIQETHQLSVELSRASHVSSTLAKSVRGSATPPRQVDL